MKKIFAQYHFLVVDDEKDIADTVADLLSMWGGTVQIAHSGNAAKRLLEQTNNKIDFVLSDVRMSDGDGVELLKAIRQNNSERPVVVMMSGWSDYTRNDFLAMGAFDLITKPFELKVLGDIISQAFGEQNPPN